MTHSTQYQPHTTYYQQLEAQPLARLEAAVQLDWQVGDVILDLYEITALLGEGGMGKVFRAHHRGWNIDLAVKCPKPDVFASAQGQQDYIREAETWINLGLHPHIASCFYVRTLGGVPRLFAECVEGGSLESWITSGALYQGGKPAALQRILDVAIQFAWGLAYAHQQGLVHQDVKPHNVLMTPQGVAKVTDFGLARARPSVSGESGFVSAGGYTPAYCSPEQAAGYPLDHRTDLWSWAVSILEMFTGGVTWQLPGQYAASVLEDYLSGSSSDAQIPAMPSRLAGLLASCLSERLEDRPAEMLTVVEALQAMYGDLAGSAYPRLAPAAMDLLSESLNNRALSLLDLGQPQEAATAWEQARQADPHHPESVYNQGLHEWRAGEQTDVTLVEQLREVAASRGNEWIPSYLLAWVHLERDDCPAALEALQGIGAADRRENHEIDDLQRQVQARLPASRRLLGRFDARSRWVHSVSLNNDGSQLLEGTWTSPEMVLWNSGVLAGGKAAALRSFKAHGNGMNSVRISPDGRYALSGGRDWQVKLWEIRKGKCLHTLKGHKHEVMSAVFNAEASLILTGSSDQTLKLWDVKKGKCLHTFTGHVKSVNAVAITRDSRLAISGSSDHTLRIWDLTTGKCLRALEGHDKEVYAVSLSSDGRQALSASWDQTIRLWDVSTGACLRVFRGHSGFVYSATFSADGARALSAGDQTVRLWDVPSGRCLRTFSGDQSALFSVSLSGNGQVAAAGGGGTALWVWQVNVQDDPPTAPYLLARVRTSEELQARQAVFYHALEAARRALAEDDLPQAAANLRSARSIPGFERQRAGLAAWAGLAQRLPRGKLRGAWQVHDIDAHRMVVSAAALSADGAMAATGSWDDTLKLWDLRTARCLRTFDLPAQWVAAALSPGGEQLLSGHGGHTLYTWDTATGARLLTMEKEKEPVLNLSGVSASPDGRLLLSGGVDPFGEAGGLFLWDAQRGEVVQRIVFPVSNPGRITWECPVALLPGGQYALAGCVNEVRLWQLATGEVLRSLRGHRAGVLCLALSAGGNFAVSGGDDQKVCAWEIPGGRLLQTLSGHTMRVTCVAVSPDGSFALSGSDDKTIRLWDTRRGECLWLFEGHTQPVRALAWSVDGQRMLSGDKGGRVKLWALDWELQDRRSTAWDEGALPYLQAFLAWRTPPSPTGEASAGRPTWDAKDFKQLLFDLGCAGFGWLQPEGIQDKLAEMTGNAEI